jgi:hypothetical protein
MRLVIVESPYRGNIIINESYARRAMHDCLVRGEAPFASHLLYTQPGVLQDEDPFQRRVGITAGLAWGKVADAHIFYTDLGWSEGMLQALAHCRREERATEFRALDGRIRTPDEHYAPIAENRGPWYIVTVDKDLFDDRNYIFTAIDNSGMTAILTTDRKSADTFEGKAEALAFIDRIKENRAFRHLPLVAVQE